jgi:hypothetical protein
MDCRHVGCDYKNSESRRHDIPLEDNRVGSLLDLRLGALRDLRASGRRNGPDAEAHHPSRDYGRQAGVVVALLLALRDRRHGFCQHDVDR